MYAVWAGVRSKMLGVYSLVICRLAIFPKGDSCPSLIAVYRNIEDYKEPPKKVATI